MMLEHLNCGQGHKALELFLQMEQEGVEPGSVTFVGVLNACASVVALEDGRCVHVQIIESGWDSNLFVGSSLLDMYAKCESMEDAWKVFNKMPSQNVVSWSAIFGGCVMHGHGKEALKHFDRMHEEGVQPDDITFVYLLSACSHAGLVDEGMCCLCFNEHSLQYFCKIGTLHLLGCAGHLLEAEDIVKAMPCKPHVVALRALLGTCTIHGNVEMGEWIAKQVLELASGNSAGYVLL
jgi:pentatricopeptide repeat protein